MKTLDPELWRRAATLFEAALDVPARLREEFVRAACGEDHELRAAVDSLLSCDAGDPSCLATTRPGSFGAGALGSDPARTWLGAYRVLSRIGRGGMGAVYLAERQVDELTTQRVAIKVIEAGAQPAALRLFRRERQILARLEHPNIARFLDGGSTEEGLPYAVLEYVEGVPVTAYCNAMRLDLRGRLELFQKVCAAVQYAHRHLVVHRDLKPANVLVTDQGEPKLLDFGIAKLADLPAPPAPRTTQDRFLTPDYASPEQLEDQPVTTASDVYSLGVVLYELLTGCLPRDPRAATEEPPPPSACARAAGAAAAPGEPADPAARAAARGTTPDRLRRALRGDLDNIVLRCLRREPGRRYESVAHLAEDLRRHLAGLPVAAQPPTAAYWLRKFVRRHALASAALAVAALALAASLVMQILYTERLAGERDAARKAQQQAEEVTRVLSDSFRLADPYQRADLGQRAGQEATVREFLDLSTERVDREHFGEPLAQARLLCTLGEVYNNFGLHVQAISLLERALAIQRRLHGPTHPEVVATLNRLGSALIEAGHLKQAEGVLRDELAIWSRSEDNSLRAESLTALGHLLITQTEYVNAERILLQAVEVRRQIDRLQSRASARTLTLLGGARWLKGDFRSAEQPLRESIDILRRLVGERHPDMAKALHYLGWTLAHKGETAEAEALLRKVLALRLTLHGPEHPETLSSQATLGEFFLYQGDYRAALPVLQEVLALDRKIRGEDHPNNAINYNSLGLAHWGLGDLVAAESALRNSIRVALKSWGPDQAGTVRYFHNLGELLHAKGEIGAAEAILRRILRQRLDMPGEDQSSLADTQASLADLLAETGRCDEALPMAEAAERIYLTAPCEGSPLSRQAYKQVYPADHWRPARARNIVGACLAEKGRFEAAERLLLESVPLLERADTPNRRAVVRTARRRLFHLYKAWGRTDRARELRGEMRLSSAGSPAASPGD